MRILSATSTDRALARRLLALARPHWQRLALAGFCLLLATGCSLALPLVVRLLTDTIFVHHDLVGLQRVCVLLVLVVVGSAVFGFGRGYFLSYAGNRIIADLRVRLYSHLQDLSLSFYDEHHTGELMSRLTADTALVQTVVTDNLLSLVQQVVTLVVVVILVLVLDWRLAALTLAVAPLLAITAMMVGRRTRHLSEKAQESLGQASIVVQETLSAVRIVRAFAREAYEIGRYSAAIDRSVTVSVTAARLNAFLGAVMTTAASGAAVLVLWVGGHEVIAGRLTPGGLISFLFYLFMLAGPLQTLASLYGSFQQALGGAARIFALLDVVPSIVDAPGAPALPPVRGYVALRDVSFAYHSEGPAVLEGVTLEVQAGQTVALVGPSGAGKTTLISLLPRYYEPQAGHIFIDDHDIAAVTMQSLRAVIALVPQEPTLFGGTVRENIAYGRLNATQAEVEAAARTANAHGFIMLLPRGYDSVIGERGVKLSGGQRQRLAIARAVLKDPRLLLLDEATSALDNESEALVQEALERLMAGRTTIVIAHRLTTVERADLIVVLDGGRVVEQGTHQDLLAQGGLYYRLAMRDFAAPAAPAQDTSPPDPVGVG